MEGVSVSIDRIVIDFTDVYWDFFNEFHKRICHFYGVKMTVGKKDFNTASKSTQENISCISPTSWSLLRKPVRTR